MAAQNWPVTAIFLGKAWWCLVSSGLCGHAVCHWMETGMGAVWKQCYQMLTASYHVESSGSGCMGCLATMGSTLGANMYHRGMFCISHFLFHGNLTCSLVHWAHRMKTLMLFWCCRILLLVFCRKDLCEARVNSEVSSFFSDEVHTKIRCTPL